MGRGRQRAHLFNPIFRHIARRFRSNMHLSLRPTSGSEPAVKRAGCATDRIDIVQPIASSCFVELIDSDVVSAVEPLKL